MSAFDKNGRRYSTRLAVDATPKPCSVLLPTMSKEVTQFLLETLPPKPFETITLERLEFTLAEPIEVITLDDSEDEPTGPEPVAGCSTEVGAYGGSTFQLTKSKEKKTLNRKRERREYTQEELEERWRTNPSKTKKYGFKAQSERARFDSWWAEERLQFRIFSFNEKVFLEDYECPEDASEQEFREARRRWRTRYTQIMERRTPTLLPKRSTIAPWDRPKPAMYFCQAYYSDVSSDSDSD